MFTLEYATDEDDYLTVKLILEINGMKTVFSVEDTKTILHVDTNASSGKIEKSPGESLFSLKWDPNDIEIFSYHEGCGELFVHIPSTPELLTSFRDALEKWKFAVAENDPEYSEKWDKNLSKNVSFRNVSVRKPEKWTKNLSKNVSFRKLTKW